MNTVYLVMFENNITDYESRPEPLFACGTKAQAERFKDAFEAWYRRAEKYIRKYQDEYGEDHYIDNADVRFHKEIEFKEKDPMPYIPRLDSKDLAIWLNAYAAITIEEIQLV